VFLHYYNTMTAAVSPLPMPLQLPGSTQEARKRRRELLASQRTTVMETSVEDVAPSQVVSDSETSEPKRRKLSESAKSKGKKPQMKYDPEVPMTKEEAAAWRREQRRKRNRESAAASRQRQRDRISELEIELGGWKDKYEAMMDQIKTLEKTTGKSAKEYMGPEQSQFKSFSKIVSPPTSPRHSPPSLEAEPSPVASSSLITTVEVTPTNGLEKQIIGGTEPEHTDNLISRQASS
jgi:hypothetical protein